MNNKKILTSLLLTVFTANILTGCSTSLTNGGKSANSRKLADVVGVVHTSGSYHLDNSEDFLNEGADQLLKLGTRVIKVFMTPKYKTLNYPFNSNWPEVSSLEDMANTDYFKTLFKKPFTTYVIEAFEIAKPGTEDEINFYDGLSAEEAAMSKKQFYDLTKYLMTTYQGTGKTFVLQNWEADSVFKTTNGNPLDTVAKGMIDWLNARQDGIDQARNELKNIKGVRVLGAAEVNNLPMGENLPPAPNAAVEKVVPFTHMDLYSYSDYQTGTSTQALKYALSYLAKKAPDDKKFGFGDKNIYLGEYGGAENLLKGEKQQLDLVKAENEAALEWGVQYTLYWELYCNEPVETGFSGTPANNDMKGYWLIRPDGSKPLVWNYFNSQLSGNKIINDLLKSESSDQG